MSIKAIGKYSFPSRQFLVCICTRTSANGRAFIEFKKRYRVGRCRPRLSPVDSLFDCTIYVYRVFTPMFMHFFFLLFFFLSHPTCRSSSLSWNTLRGREEDGAEMIKRLLTGKGFWTNDQAAAAASADQKPTSEILRRANVSSREIWQKFPIKLSTPYAQFRPSIFRYFEFLICAATYVSTI